ncbi:hypothetical protein GGR56DRAFT_214117 [Xylariaceae sp. FL0804]|nr:hypothetical protein GGR56DRAFT_214117 [Xylariaceae sp. FL0804]
MSLGLLHYEPASISIPPSYGISPVTAAIQRWNPTLRPTPLRLRTAPSQYRGGLEGTGSMFRCRPWRVPWTRPFRQVRLWSEMCSGILASHELLVHEQYGAGPSDPDAAPVAGRLHKSGLPNRSTYLQIPCVPARGAIRRPSASGPHRHGPDSPCRDPYSHATGVPDRTLPPSSRNGSPCRGPTKGIGWATASQWLVYLGAPK